MATTPLTFTSFSPEYASRISKYGHTVLALVEATLQQLGLDRENLEDRRTALARVDRARPDLTRYLTALEREALVKGFSPSGKTRRPEQPPIGSPPLYGFAAMAEERAGGPEAHARFLAFAETKGIDLSRSYEHARKEFAIAEGRGTIASAQTFSEVVATVCERDHLAPAIMPGHAMKAHETAARERPDLIPNDYGPPRRTPEEQTEAVQFAEAERRTLQQKIRTFAEEEGLDLNDPRERGRAYIEFARRFPEAIEPVR